MTKLIRRRVTEELFEEETGKKDMKAEHLDDIDDDDEAEDEDEEGDDGEDDDDDDETKPKKHATVRRRTSRR